MAAGFGNVLALCIMKKFPIALHVLVLILCTGCRSLVITDGSSQTNPTSGEKIPSSDFKLTGGCPPGSKYGSPSPTHDSDGHKIYVVRCEAGKSVEEPK